MFERELFEGNLTRSRGWAHVPGALAFAVGLLVFPGTADAQTPATGNHVSPGEGDVSAALPVVAPPRNDSSSRSEASGDTFEAPSDEELGLVPERPRVRPTRVDSPPEIDGRLDDEAWERAPVLTEFTQQAPLDGAPATEETEVWVAYDDDHLYFAIHAHYQQPEIMRANRVDRDRAMADDLFTVYLDPFLDQQRAYDFDVNAYGVQGDGVLSAGGGGAIPRADRSWDALFESGGRVVSDGFTAELAIPFKSLRYPSPADGRHHVWGLQIVREVKSKDQENIVWAPMSRDESSFFAQMGVLEGMEGLSTSRNIEILPTVTAVQYGAIDPTRSGGPGFVNQSTDPDAGVNVKYGITPNLTADFTLNPDFSQIESDRPQIEVNQRFPLFYQELRPF
ncbi:MAG: sugar-binding protein, partial [Longimicrobiales bacterium]